MINRLLYKSVMFYQFYLLLNCLTPSCLTPIGNACVQVDMKTNKKLCCDYATNHFCNYKVPGDKTFGVLQASWEFI